jgi:hypothetical protein
MPLPSDIAGIAAMRIGKGVAQAVLIGGYRDEVDMIGHETVMRPVSRFAQEIRVQRIVAFFKEDAIAPVAALRDVVRLAGDNDPR